MSDAGTGRADPVLSGNERYALGYGGAAGPARPARSLAVLACMDARLDVPALLGLSVGEAHVIRNAGGLVTDDALRSLTISQRLLGTTAIVLVHHTDCGMLGLADDEFRRTLRTAAGVEPPWQPGGFTDLDEDVRRSIAAVRDCPFLAHTDNVRGFVFDVATGRLREIS